MRKSMYTLIALMIFLGMFLVACSSEDTPTPEPVVDEPAAPTTEAQAAPTEEPAMEKVTVTWWHITTDEGQAAVWQSLADSYMAEHPNVTIEISILENEAFKTKLTLDGLTITDAQLLGDDGLDVLEYGGALYAGIEFRMRVDRQL